MTSENTESSVETVRRLYEECVNRGRVELLPELIAADYVGPQGGTGPAGYRATVESLRAGMPDIRFTIEDLVAEGDRVVVRWTWTGRHTGTFRGFKPTSAQIENSGIAIYQLRGGKVIRSWLETDRLGVLQQMGVVDPGLGGGGAGARKPVTGPSR
jgi:predicted ester cyclase